MTLEPNDKAMRLDAAVHAWNAAAEHWDAAALAARYTDDALLLGGRPGHSTGQDSIAAYFESYRGVILSATLTLSNQQVIATGPTSLLAQGFGDFAFRLAGGKDTRQAMRTTLLLDWSDGAPRIRVHHFSPVPDAPPLGG